MVAVMQLLGKLECAAQCLSTAPAETGTEQTPGSSPVRAGAAPSPQAETIDVEMDEDILGQMAEAAVPPTEEHGSEETRKALVAGAKARLMAKRGDLASLLKVRKATK